jgi:hypothetical protein
MGFHRSSISRFNCLHYFIIQFKALPKNWWCLNLKSTRLRPLDDQCSPDGRIYSRNRARRGSADSCFDVVIVGFFNKYREAKSANGMRIANIGVGLRCPDGVGVWPSKAYSDVISIGWISAARDDARHSDDAISLPAQIVNFGIGYFCSEAYFGGGLGSPNAARAYAWSEKPPNGKRFFALLEKPPIKSALDAVRPSIVADKKKTG